MSLFNQTTLSPAEYVLKYSLIYLGMRKLQDEKVDKIKTNEDNEHALKSFFDKERQDMFLFAIPTGGESLQFQSEPPAPEKIKKKVLLILRARSKKDVGEINADNIDKEVIFMEINRQILENLYLVCNDVYMPVLGNPLNMIGWSDLVSQDLMDRFHVFLAHTYVTIGQVKGRTLLPLPPNDVTSSEKTSSKDKAQLLEGAIVHWTK